ncbi:MAG: aldehyde dehydrogenase family protein [Candidatus Micrarchaeota archaeon]
MKNFSNLINGEWKSAASGKTFENRNPSDTGEVLGAFPRSGKEDIDAAVKAAKEAFPGWSKTTPPARGRMLLEIARKMEERKEELAKIIMKEVGKTMKECLGEVCAGIDMCNFMAGEGRGDFGQVTYSELPDRIAMTKRYPIGVCGIILPWNFPISLVSWKVFPAILCGNSVVVKPAEDAPESVSKFGEILLEAGLPKGVVNIVNGFGHEAGEALVNHPGVSMISFTGSSEVGRKIAATCGQRLAKVSLELGGKNAAIVMDDSDLDLAVDCVRRGAFSVAGERCTATSRAIVHKDVHDEFVKRLLEGAKKMKVGPGHNEDTEICPIINQKQLDNVLSYVEIGKKEGATLLLGGGRLAGGDHDKGFYTGPTIFTDVKPEMRIAREEIFGPVLVVLKADSFDDAIRIHNDSDYGLSAAVFTKDMARSLSAVDRMEAGVCYANGPTFGSEVHLPFGGVKKSGNGHREVGKAALEIFSEYKTIYLDYSGGVQNAQYKK